jgi:integrase
MINKYNMGGNYRPAYVSPVTYERIVVVVSTSGGKAHWSEDKFRLKLEAAALKTGQHYTGPHGLRHCFARERMTTSQKSMSYLAALGQVSQEMGHSRSDITLLYLT